MPLVWGPGLCRGPELVCSELNMSAFTLAEAAACAPEWLLAWALLDETLKERLCRVGLGKPLVWAGIRGGPARLRSLLDAFHILDDADLAPGRLAACEALQRAARSVGEDWSDSTARLSDMQVSVDISQEAKKRRLAAEIIDLAKARASRVFAKPVIWGSRIYRRAEATGDAQARKRAEEADRNRWAKRVVKIIVDAGLPFGVEIVDKGWDSLSPDAGRCLRGLRASTLKKRTSDITPFLRYLRCETGELFPRNKDVILQFFATRLEEQAPRSVFRSLLLALKFFEEAGEVRRDLRVSDAPGLESTVKEYERRRRLLGEAAGTQVGRRQAPQMLIAVLVALEAEVLNELKPLFVRAYAWYRWLRHWASLRYNDTEGCSPQSLSIRARGVAGVLERTKTTGADKGIAVLPIFVSLDAYIAREWLLPGLEIWKNTELGFARDYLLVLQNRDLSGTCGKRARYSDARGFSQALMSSITLEGDSDPLLIPEAIEFWSEHSVFWF